MSDVRSVHLLWHAYERDDCEEAKLIGVYATLDDAEAAQKRVMNQPGFADKPEGFEIAEYLLGQDHWTEGFVTV